MQPQPIIPVLQRHNHDFHPVVPFDPRTDKILLMDFTEKNTSLTTDIFENNEKFCAYIENKLNTAHSLYGIGGYNELRTIYSRSKLFGTTNSSALAGRLAGVDEPRRLHLGVDIWGRAGTPVYAFMGGMIHSFAFNNQPGDYGATLILLHQLEGISFYSLYGHISQHDIEKMYPGQYVTRGEIIAHFGEPAENGYWPPHLHIQLILDMELKAGDYPGVCKFSEREKYLSNCPDPELVLKLQQFL